MNINKYIPKHINIDVAQAEAPAYAGTFNELYNLIKDQKVSLVTHDDGQVIGIYVESGADSLMLDDLAGRNFSRAYSCKPMMQWVEIIIDAAQKGKEITDINENEGTCVIDGEVIQFTEKHTSTPRTTSEHLPTEVELNIEEDLDGDDSDVSIKSYLRDTYDHYLSGSADNAFEVTREDNTIKVTNIQWGRKR